MKTITLCAGVGSRLRPETNFVPKCLVKFDGKPILLRQLDAFRSCGLTKNYIVTGYLDEKIDYVVHLASCASPKAYAKYPINTLKSGSIGTINALGISKQHNAKFF